MLISDELAQKNGLSVGDTITAQNFDPATGELYGNILYLEIIGIYTINFEQDISEWTSEVDILSNKIFSSIDLDEWWYYEYKKHYGGQVRSVEKSDSILWGMTYYMDDPALLPATMEKIRATDIVDWEYYVIERNDNDYETLAGPLQTMVNLSTALVVIMAAGCLIVLSLILTMWVRSRRREIGILSSIGIKKGGVLTQFLLECLLLVIVAFLAAALLSGPVTHAAGNALAASLSPSAQAEPYRVEFKFETGTMDIYRTPTDQISLLYRVGPDAMAVVFGAMAAVACASTFLSARCVVRLKPRELLTKR